MYVSEQDREIEAVTKTLLRHESVALTIMSITMPIKQSDTK